MKAKINKIILGVLDENSIHIEPQNITDSTKLIDDLGFDSFSLAQLTVEIEAEFGIDIFEDEIITTVGQIYNQVS